MGDGKPAYAVDRPAAVEHDGCDEDGLPPWIHKPHRHTGYDHPSHSHNKDRGCEDSTNKDKALKPTYFLDTFFLFGILPVNRGACAVHGRRVRRVYTICVIYAAMGSIPASPGTGACAFPGSCSCVFTFRTFP